MASQTTSQSHIATVGNNPNVVIAMDMAAPSGVEESAAIPVSGDNESDMAADLVTLENALSMLQAQIMQLQSLMEQLPAEERDEYAAELSLAMGAKGAVASAISRPSEASVDRALRIANKALINGGYAAIDGMEDELSSGDLVPRQRSQKNNHKMAGKSGGNDSLSAIIDPAELRPEARVYFQPMMDAIAQLLAEEEVQAARADREAAGESPEAALYHELIARLDQILPPEQLATLQARMGEQWLPEQLEQQRAYAEAEGALSPDYLSQVGETLQAYQTGAISPSEEEEQEIIEAMQLATLATMQLAQQAIQQQQATSITPQTTVRDGMHQGLVQQREQSISVGV